MASKSCKALSKDSTSRKLCNSLLSRGSSVLSLSGGEAESPPFSSISGSDEDDNRRLKRKLAGLTRYTEQLERHLLRVHNLWQKESQEKIRLEKIAFDIAKGAADFSQKHKRPRSRETSHPEPAAPEPNMAPPKPQGQSARQPHPLSAEHHSDTNLELGRKIRAAANSDSTSPHQPHMAQSNMEQFVCEWGEETSELDKEFVTHGNLVDPLEPPNVPAWGQPTFMRAPVTVATVFGGF